MTTLDETPTPTDDVDLGRRTTLDGPVLPWRRPTPSPFRTLAIADDVLDEHRLALSWWADGVAFVLDTEDGRTVLSVPAARDLAEALTATLDELHDEAINPPPSGRWAAKHESDDDR